MQMQVAHQQAFVFAASQQVRSHVGFKKLPAGSYPGLQFEHAEVSGAVRLLTSALSLLQNILCNSLAIAFALAYLQSLNGLNPLRALKVAGQEEYVGSAGGFVLDAVHQVGRGQHQLTFQLDQSFAELFRSPT